VPARFVASTPARALQSAGASRMLRTLLKAAIAASFGALVVSTMAAALTFDVTLALLSSHRRRSRGDGER
jgi:hypothetical protein